MCRRHNFLVQYDKAKSSVFHSCPMMNENVEPAERTVCAGFQIGNGCESSSRMHIAGASETSQLGSQLRERPQCSISGDSCGRPGESSGLKCLNVCKTTAKHNTYNIRSTPNGMHSNPDFPQLSGCANRVMYLTMGAPAQIGK